MLSLPERIIFLLASLLTIYLAVAAIRRLVAIIGRGRGRPEWKTVARRILDVVVLKTLALGPTFRVRPLISLLHGMVAWGFMYYLLVNVGDVLQCYLPDFVFLGEGRLGNLYRSGADALSVAALAGMVALLLRRFALRPKSMSVGPNTLLHPKASAGIQRDSLIVGVFILLHVGFRFLGESWSRGWRSRDTQAGGFLWE